MNIYSLIHLYSLIYYIYNKFEYPTIAEGILLQHYSLFNWNSNLAGIAKSGILAKECKQKGDLKTEIMVLPLSMIAKLRDCQARPFSYVYMYI